MRHVIYATKAEDLRKEMADYDATTTELQTRYNNQSNDYRQRIHEEGQALEQEVREAIGPSSIEDIQIVANLSWDFASSRDDVEGTNWRVYIKVNDNSKWDDKTALSWNYDVDLDSEGNVKKETGSWSGLKATTVDQIDDLKESVRLMEIINSIDWPALLHRASIKWDDFVDEDNATALRDRQKNRPNYEDQIAAAEVEEYIGQPVWILLSGSPSSQWGTMRGEYYAKINRETAARYNIDLVPAKYAQTTSADVYTVRDLTVNKANFLAKVVKPVDTFTE